MSEREQLLGVNEYSSGSPLYLENYTVKTSDDYKGHQTPLEVGDTTLTLKVPGQEVEIDLVQLLKWLATNKSDLYRKCSIGNLRYYRVSNSLTTIYLLAESAERAVELVSMDNSVAKAISFEEAEDIEVLPFYGETLSSTSAFIAKEGIVAYGEDYDFSHIPKD